MCIFKELFTIQAIHLSTSLPVFLFRCIVYRCMCDMFFFFLFIINFRHCLYVYTKLFYMGDVQYI